MAELAISIVIEALPKVYEICKQMNEFDDLCISVHHRLETIAGALRDVPESELHSLLSSYRAEIDSFREFLVKYQPRRWAHRIWSYRKISARIQSFHESIDKLHDRIYLVLVTTTAQTKHHMVEMHAQMTENNQEMVAWRKEMNVQMKNVHLLQKRMASDTRAIRAEANRTNLESSAKMIQYELDSKRSLNPPEHLEVMQTAYDQILKAASETKKVLPQWFISDNDVDYDESKPFDAGAFGQVFRGTWGEGSEVVIKVLFATDDKARRDFNRELEVWHMLNHPHVTKLYGACDVTSSPFFVSEDATGGNFVQYFAKNGKSQIWRLFYEAAQGLRYLHQRRVIHGDLKCANLLVGSDNRARICDFGFSYVRTASVGLSAKAQAEAIRWKAPETLMQEDSNASPDDYNPRWASDVYSFGLSIWEAFTGEPPFGTDADDDIMEYLVDDTFKMPRPNSDEITDEQWEFVLKLLCHDWHDRMLLPDVIARLREFKLAEAAANGTEQLEEAIAELSIHACQGCNAKTRVGDVFCSACGVRLEAIVAVTAA